MTLKKHTEDKTFFNRDKYSSKYIARHREVLIRRGYLCKLNIRQTNVDEAIERAGL